MRWRLTFARADSKTDPDFSGLSEWAGGLRLYQKVDYSLPPLKLSLRAKRDFRTNIANFHVWFM